MTYIDQKHISKPTNLNPAYVCGPFVFPEKGHLNFDTEHFLVLNKASCRMWLWRFAMEQENLWKGIQGKFGKIERFGLLRRERKVTGSMFRNNQR